MSTTVNEPRGTVTVSDTDVVVTTAGATGPAGANGADGADGADGVGPIDVTGVQNALVVSEQETLTTIGAGPSGAAGYTTDLVEAMIAAGIDTSSGRVGFNYDEGAMFFGDNARYPLDPATINFQMPHGYVEGSAVNFHLHWIQAQNAVPNWLGRYRVLPLGGEVGAWSSLSTTTLVFSYGTTTHQISDFFNIDMTGAGISSVVQVQVWRDTDNDSTLFAGTDPYTGDALAISADLHYIADSVGSVGTYDKDGI